MLDFLGGIGGAVANWFSGERNRDTQMQIANNNIALQREFAQNGIQWKVQDAIKAGLHPLAALGASTSSFSPVSIGDTGAGGMENMGQDISRAMKAAQNHYDRETDVTTKAATALQLERGSLENELLKTQIAKLRGQIGPALPTGGGSKVSGQGDSMKDAPAPEYAGLRAGGSTSHNPNFSDAQEYENRYGDIGENVAGVGNFFADTWQTLRNDPQVMALMTYLRSHGANWRGPNSRFPTRSRWLSDHGRGEWLQRYERR